LFLPQQATVPEAVKAQVKSRPEAIVSAGAAPGTSEVTRVSARATPGTSSETAKNAGILRQTNTLSAQTIRDIVLTLLLKTGLTQKRLARLEIRGQ
jgi:hypothetical protein